MDETLRAARWWLGRQLTRLGEMLLAGPRPVTLFRIVPCPAGRRIVRRG